MVASSREPEPVASPPITMYRASTDPGLTLKDTFSTSVFLTPSTYSFASCPSYHAVTWYHWSNFSETVGRGDAYQNWSSYVLTPCPRAPFRRAPRCTPVNNGALV